MILLSLDIGNTRIKYGLFQEHRLLNSYILSNTEELTSISNIKEISDIAISSVVPKSTKEVVLKLKELTSVQPIEISKDSRFNLKIEYKSKETLGIDRICSAEGAFAQCSKSLSKGTYLITIDFGTATTINIVRPPNIFIGGLIAPGINTMFKSLKLQTAQLPELTLENYFNFVGQNTNTSIASGVLNASVGLIERTLKYISESYDCKEVIIYTTGGLAKRILNHLPDNIIYDEFLVLRGIDSVYELNKD